MLCLLQLREPHIGRLTFLDSEPWHAQYLSLRLPPCHRDTRLCSTSWRAPLALLRTHNAGNVAPWNSSSALRWHPKARPVVFPDPTLQWSLSQASQTKPSACQDHSKVSDFVKILSYSSFIYNLLTNTKTATPRHFDLVSFHGWRQAAVGHW